MRWLVFDCIVFFGWVYLWLQFFYFLLSLLSYPLQIRNDGWFYETNPVNGSFGGAARTKYDTAGIDISQTGKTVVTPVENAADGVQFSTEEVNLQKNYSTIAQYRTYKSNNSDWASVSYSYSST